GPDVEVTNDHVFRHPHPSSAPADGNPASWRGQRPTQDEPSGRPRRHVRPGLSPGVRGDLVSPLSTEEDAPWDPDTTRWKDLIPMSGARPSPTRSPRPTRT